MKKSVRERERRRRTKPSSGKALKWVAVLAVVALVGYGVSQMDGVPYGERELGVVSFADLSSNGKRSALKAANLRNDPGAVHRHRQHVPRPRREHR